MSKAQWDKPHFLSRTGPHSDKGLRSGHVESLPSIAKDAVYAELHRRGDECRQGLHLLEEARARGGHSKPDLRLIIKRKKQLQAELTALRKSQQENYLPRYESEFLRLARLLLADDLLEMLDERVVAELGFPPRHWNSFLARKGYGWVDKTTYEPNSEQRR